MFFSSLIEVVLTPSLHERIYAVEVGLLVFGGGCDRTYFISSHPMRIFFRNDKDEASVVDSICRHSPSSGAFVVINKMSEGQQ